MAKNAANLAPNVDNGRLSAPQIWHLESDFVCWSKLNAANGIKTLIINIFFLKINASLAMRELTHPLFYENCLR